MKVSILTILTCTGLTLPAQVGAPPEGQGRNDTANYQSLPEKLHEIHSNDVKAALDAAVIQLRKNDTDSLNGVADSITKKKRLFLFRKRLNRDTSRPQ